MPIQVASSLIPKGGALWPILDDKYIVGGARVVADAAAMNTLYTNAVTRAGLKIGMLLVTQSDKKLWMYMGSGQFAEYKANLMLTFTQETPLDVWAIQHNAGSQNLTYTVFDDTNTQVFPDTFQIIDDNNLMLSFLMPLSGRITIAFHK